jgi:uracil-DNA glycosylase family 4
MSQEEAPFGPGQPPGDCTLCARLAAFRAANRRQFPAFHNAPVPSFGAAEARLLVVGLAPGLRGANRTGRPFTGDYAGDLLYPTLLKFGFAEGSYAARPDDGFRLCDARVTNAVRCVPPENKPTGPEAATCGRFLRTELAGMPRLAVIVALGAVAHKAVLAAVGARQSRHPFAHGAIHDLPDGRLLADSYHSSRYNVSTRRLTPAMFEAVFAEVRRRLDGAG